MAATVIDSLLMTLGLDPSGFDSGKKKAASDMLDLKKKAKQTAKDVKGSGKEAAEFFGELKKGALQFFSVLTAGVGLGILIKETTEASAALGLLAKNLDTATETVAAWSNAAELAGGSSAGLQGTMGMLSKSMTEMQVTGQTAILPYLRALSVNMADASGHARPLDDILLDLADRFEHMDRATAFNFGQMMGIDPGTLNLLLQGRKAVDEMIRKQREHALTTKRDAEEALKLKAAFIGMTQAGAGAARALMSVITPALEAMFNWLARVAELMSEHKEAATIFFASIATAVTVYFLPAILAGTRALTAFGIALAANPYTWVAAAIIAIGAAIALMYDDYQTWKKGGDSLINWGKWQNEIEFVTDMVKNFVSLIEGAWSGLQKLKFWKSDKGTTTGTAPMAENKAGAVTGRVASRDTGAAVAELQKQGWTRQQALGMVANLQSESGLNPNAIGDNGKAYGIAQWHPDRQANFKKWAGHDIRNSTLQEQLGFMSYELRQGTERKAGAALAATRDEGSAARVVSQQYERPAATEAEAAKRAALAQAMARQDMLGGAPGALAAAAPAGARGTAASAPGAVSNSSEVHIGQIVVQTQATDAKGIARDIGGSLRERGLVAQADQGMT